jgi:hypothetical protein
MSWAYFLQDVRSILWSSTTNDNVYAYILFEARELVINLEDQLCYIRDGLHVRRWCDISTYKLQRATMERTPTFEPIFVPWY